MNKACWQSSMVVLFSRNRKQLESGYRITLIYTGIINHHQLIPLTNINIENESP